jgi:hypothetical protein
MEDIRINHESIDQVCESLFTRQKCLSSRPSPTTKKMSRHKSCRMNKEF